jgi:hypothetical protein
MYHKVLGSFADVPAVIRVNGASLDSTVSLSFLHNFNVLHCNHDGMAVESSSGLVHRQEKTQNAVAWVTAI